MKYNQSHHHYHKTRQKTIQINMSTSLQESNLHTKNGLRSTVGPCLSVVGLVETVGLHVLYRAGFLF